MGMRWNTFGLWLRIYICLISLEGIRECWSLNEEGLALLEFRARITSDPYAALANWNPSDCDPCMWMGVYCEDGKVQMLDLNGLSLEGTLAFQLGKLSHLKSLVLCKNNFSGTIPKEIGDLARLELLDLRENNLTGSIPAEIGKMMLLKHLLLCDNKIEGSDSQDLEKLRLPSKSQLFDDCLSPLTTLFPSINRKIGRCVWQGNLKQWNQADSLVIPTKEALMKYLNAFALPLFKLGKVALHGYEENCCDTQSSSDEPEITQNVPNLVNSVRRKLLDQSSNLAAAPATGGPNIEISSLPTTLSSGAFPAVPDANKEPNQSPAPLPSPSGSSHDASNRGHSSPPSDNGGSGNWWKYIIIISCVALLVILLIVILCIWRKRAAKIISPWKTGLSGQLQKAFITGVPKLNRGELETACEDFSNIIIDNFDGCTIYKGTLSSGIEIAVVSTVVTSSQDWSKNMEMAYRKKIDTLSRVNHKNFVNLIGYCEEEEPFTRMMVFEYAPNGSIFEHLHVKEVERLDWSERMRIVMGTAYCLQYMHHDLNPPVSHTNLSSVSILLTDDFAAKIGEITFGNIVSAGGESKKSELPPRSDPETDVYNFGILLLEIISGKLPHSEEQGSLVDWAAEYLNDKRSSMIDPNLESFEGNELDVICEVIQDCIQPDPRSRATMRDITSRLKEVIDISPEQAVPRLSPLWWAELEILSVEAT